MKAFFAIITIVLALANPARAGESSYVVIGAFAIRGNAVRCTEKAQAKQYKAEFDINPTKKLFYVFIMKTEDLASALAEATRLRKETPYTDAWVFLGNLGEGGGGVDLVMETPKETEVQQPVVEQPVAEDPKPPAEEPAAELPKNDVALDPKANAKDFYFKVMKEDGSAVDGAEITVVEPRSQRKEYALKSNENVVVKAVNQSGMMRLECDLAGYRKISQMMNFKFPDSIQGVFIENNLITVPFYMVRLKKGDNAILYNVFFYKDAAIMRPESKADLDGLLAMMNENPRYKIKIHGHTNGSSSGPILEAGAGNLFSITGATEGKGSAKKLSEKRANVIRDYLVQNGVDVGRMTVKAWGGKKPIYDKRHAQASANVRVEVEVLED